IAAAYPRTRMRAGEIVYAIRGSFGNVEVIPPELEGVNLSRDAARLALQKGVDPYWLTFLLRSQFCQEQFKLKEIGATITGVNIRDLKRVVLPVPPPEEQAAIVRFLSLATADMDRVMNTTARQIAFIRELRTCVCSKIATGKLDVRVASEGLRKEVLETVVGAESDELTREQEEEIEDSPGVSNQEAEA